MVHTTQTGTFKEGCLSVKPREDQRTLRLAGKVSFLGACTYDLQDANVIMLELSLGNVQDSEEVALETLESDATFV